MKQLSIFDQSTDFRDHKKYQNGVFKTKDEIVSELHSQGVTKIYRVLSFGGGTQSTHLLEEHFRGNIDYDFIIMSDTGAEPEFIHDQVKWWQERQQAYGNTTPFIITHHNSMEGGLEEMLFRYINTDYTRLQLPVYLTKIDESTGKEKAGGLLPRQCTVDFKIVPVQMTARQLVLKELGKGPKQLLPKEIAFIIDIGFSADEINRIETYQSPQYKYMYLAYPLVEENLSTDDSIQYLIENSMPAKRSRCYFCPFNCDKKGIEWREIIESEPLSFLKACYFDEKLRAAVLGGKKTLRNIPYFHYKRVPLKEAYAAEYQAIRERHADELAEWEEKWMKIIEEKYVEAV